MDLTPYEYYTMTHAEFILKSKGYSNKKIKEWEHTREVCFQIISSGFNRPKSLPKKSHLWWRLPTDNNAYADIDKEEMTAKWEIFKNKNGSKTAS